MTEKYSVPALERANAVLNVIKDEPNAWNLSELSRKLHISKSTLYSLLLTLERMEWISRDRNDTYSLGGAIGGFVSAYAKQYDLIEDFRRKGDPVMRKLGETIQLARLEGTEVLYLAKLEAPSPVQMVAGPGVRFPSHATGLGKAMMAHMAREQITSLFPKEALVKLTVHTLGSREALIAELEATRTYGHAVDIQEGVMGFCCVAAPILRPIGEAVAAVSCSMPIHQWEHKKDLAIQEITQLAKRLSPAI